MHVVSSSRFAKKAESSGCDAVIAEGFEAGGHNGQRRNYHDGALAIGL